MTSLKRPTNWIILIIALMMAIPVLGVVIGGFGKADSWSHLWETILLDYILNTLGLLLLTGSLACIIGVGCAWAITVWDFPGRRILEWALVLPIAAPAYVIAYVYTDLLSVTGPVQISLREMLDLSVQELQLPSIRSLSGAGIMLALVLYPYVYLASRAAFMSRSQTPFLAARTLGASPLKAFWSVALPAARPAIAGGLALVLMETAADFGVADYFGISTFSTGIFRTWYGIGEPATAMRLAACLLLIVLLLVWMERASRSDMSNAKTNASGGSKTALALPLGKAFLATFFCSLPFILGFVIPVGWLAYLAITEGDPIYGPKFLSFAWNSAATATIVALIATSIALAFSSALRPLRGRPASVPTKTGIALGTLGYALPGTLLAVGLLVAVGPIDRQISGWVDAQFDLGLGLLLTGTSAALILALTIRFLTVAFNAIDGGMSGVSTRLDMAAQSLGADHKRITLYLHVPLLKPAMASALLLVFIDVMRELPATLILRPFNFETLATRVYRLASDERLAEASTSALTLVLVGLIPVIALNAISRPTRMRPLTPTKP